MPDCGGPGQPPCKPIDTAKVKKPAKTQQKPEPRGDDGPPKE